MIEFFLNGERQRVTVAPDTSVLELLRGPLGQRGTKEGCASGDCGACTVAIAEAETGDQPLEYRTANACITPAHQLQGCHLVTVEGLAHGNDLHPAQASMVACHGSQCGFCTPGFVMSLFTLHEDRRAHPGPPLDAERLESALGGNLCRCTGYRPIRDAALDMSRQPDHRPAWSEDPALDTAVHGLGRIPATDDLEPDTFLAVPTDLAALTRAMSAHPEARLVAGATDLWLETTQRLAPLNALIDLRQVKELRTIEETPDGWWIGAALTYRELEPLFARHYPALAHLLTRLGSAQIRHRGTLGGNIANASPIGDMPPALLALDAKLRLASESGIRELPLDAFFLEYKRTALQPGECIADVFLPRPEMLGSLSTRPDTLGSLSPRPEDAPGEATPTSPRVELRAWKLSKRREDDISTLLGVFRWQLENVPSGEIRLVNIRVAFGGMAAVPLRVPTVERILEGSAPDIDTFEAAKDALRNALTPMNDARGSAAYRLTAACNLLERWRLVVEGGEGSEGDPSDTTEEVMLHAYAH
ncbi:xanthine dehydrogenase small subunit [Salinicola rhizosphaerae]|uniref:Xanthine dehydrogenase n=1 Tax=Salinicola rhizosphaerae TaxID=1443141 RepID=A0ABQ3DRK6_9GAMM|nr:FAD binding domain-containing protein [Salinicola rhizosphaerae]GHB10007.1 xanthine dehydrogenase [Salinicola rhizosphaerae]